MPKETIDPALAALLDAPPSAPKPAENGAPAGEPQPFARDDGPRAFKTAVLDPGQEPRTFPDTEGSAPASAPAEPDPNRISRHPDALIGTTLDQRYLVEAVLGEGGMGCVYRARHTVIDKKVAIKALRSDLARDSEILDRFLREARAATKIGHPHIVDISDFGKLQDGSTYFVMEYLEGQSLADVMTAPLPAERICRIGQQIASGLGAAHEHGIVHRDLKPDNVFLIARGADKDFVKILDFGIAKVSTGGNSERLTRAGAVFGTPHYMSPEQSAGTPVDHRTDIYALGVILYEMAAGELPFNADNFMGILTQHMYKAPVPIRALVPNRDCPPGLEAIILKCLSKKPDGRYATMAELGEDIARFVRGEVPKAVDEMMARSGGFNVPHDYFPSPKAIVPATPPRPKKAGAAPRYAWIVASVVGAGLATAAAMTVLGRGHDAPAGTTAQQATAAEASPSPAAPTAAGPQGQPPAPEKRTVVVRAVPETALAYRGDRAIKLPEVFDIEPGQTVTLEIRADGYESQTLELDGQEPKQQVTLMPKPQKPSASGSSQRPQPAAGPRNGEIVDPWSQKKR